MRKEFLEKVNTEISTNLKKKLHREDKEDIFQETLLVALAKKVIDVEKETINKQLLRKCFLHVFNKWKNSNSMKLNTASLDQVTIKNLPSKHLSELDYGKPRGSLILTCNTCSKSFKKDLSLIRRTKNDFCSKSCYSKSLKKKD